VALTTSSGTCVLSASALAPTAAFPGAPIPFRAIASLSMCSSSISYDWDFGDGTPHATGTNVSHTYTLAADYTWTLKVTAGSATQTVQAVVTISPTLGAPLILTATSLGFLLNLSWPADAVPTSLETATDLGQPYAWQMDVDPVYFDGTNNNVQIFFPSPQQLFRVRRVP
jgi:PKD repeat protein